MNLWQFPRILKDLELISADFEGIESPFTPASPYIALQAMSLVGDAGALFKNDIGGQDLGRAGVASRMFARPFFKDC